VTGVHTLKPVEETVQKRLVRQLAEGLEAFNGMNDKPASAAVYVLMNDDGDISVGWITDDHPWPASAVIGMASRAILKEPS
jgi:hypothetical protein